MASASVGKSGAALSVGNGQKQTGALTLLAPMAAGADGAAKGGKIAVLAADGGGSASVGSSSGGRRARGDAASDWSGDIVVEEESGRRRAGTAPLPGEAGPTGTVLSSWLNITNTILGAGMLAMPGAFAGVGLGLGVVLIGVSALASGLGLYFLSRVAASLSRNQDDAETADAGCDRRASFFACARATYPHAALLIDLAIAVKCFGVAVSYIIICSDLLPQVLNSFLGNSLQPDHWLMSKWFWVTVSLAAIAPVSFFRRLDSLRYTSMFALMAVLYLVGIVVAYYWNPPPEWPSLVETGKLPPRPTWSDIEWIKFDKKFFTSFPVFVFAFTCHQNIFAVHNELVDNSISQMNMVITSSIGTAFVVYQIIGVTGYMTFGKNSPGNIIAMYPNGLPVTLGQLAISFLVLLSYPLQCHPGRASFDKVMTGVMDKIHAWRASRSADSDLSSVVGSNRNASSVTVATAVNADGVVGDAPAHLRNDSMSSSDDALSGNITSASPLLVHAENPSTTTLLTPAPISYPQQQPTKMSKSPDTIPTHRFIILTFTFILGTYFVAVSVKSLKSVLAFVGATGSTTIGYILPGLFYYKMRRNALDGSTGNPRRKYEPLQLVAIGLSVFGVCIMISSLVMQAVGVSDSH